MIKTLTIDDFYSKEEALRVTQSVYYLQYQETEFGKEIPEFNLVPPDADELFSSVLPFKVKVDQDSGTFRIPKIFIHFESFTSAKDWLFVVALQESVFNLFEHKSGCKNAAEGHKHNYSNLFEWDLLVNYTLRPGQGILFRPWLFHSFDTGLIQTFKLQQV